MGAEIAELASRRNLARALETLKQEMGRTLRGIRPDGTYEDDEMSLPDKIAAFAGASLGVVAVVGGIVLFLENRAAETRLKDVSGKLATVCTNHPDFCVIALPVEPALPAPPAPPPISPLAEALKLGLNVLHIEKSSDLALGPDVLQFGNVGNELANGSLSDRVVAGAVVTMAIEKIDDPAIAALVLDTALTRGLATATAMCAKAGIVCPLVEPLTAARLGDAAARGKIVEGLKAARLARLPRAALDQENTHIAALEKRLAQTPPIAPVLAPVNPTLPSLDPKVRTTPVPSPPPH